MTEPAEFYAKADLEADGERFTYSIGVGINPNAQDGFRLLSEMMYLPGKPPFGMLTSETEWHYIREARPELTRPLIHDPPTEDLRSRLCSAIQSIRFLNPSPERMREPLRTRRNYAGRRRPEPAHRSGVDLC